MDLATLSAQLLYTYDKLALPGLGTFVLEESDSQLDPGQGIIHPPRRDLTFNAQLTFDDGRLRKTLVLDHDVDALKAEEMVDAFVEDIRRRLEQDGKFALPQLGTFRTQPDGSISFKSAGVNYHAEAFGLPPVPAPVASKAMSTPPKTDPKLKMVLPDKKPPFTQWIRANLAWLLVLLVIILVGGTFALFGDQLFRTEPGPVENAAALDPPPPPTAAPGIPEARQEDTPEVPEEDLEADFSENTEGLTPVPDEKFFLIIVGLYGDEQNVKNAVRRIYEAGYEPITEKKGRFTRVGLQKTYEDDEELREALEYAKKHFDPQSFVAKY